jgi:acetate kinase
MNGVIITCNAGSTNTKLSTFDNETLKPTGKATTRSVEETKQWFCTQNEMAVVAVGHRVVHGGRDFNQPEIITDDVIEKLKYYIPMAPLHQPAAIFLIEECRRLYPDVPHIACFDTAFHHTMPEGARRLPLPRKFHDEGIMRYGFHGLSYQHIANVLTEHAGSKADGRVIVAHLGGGASACAMKNRQSVASTMGFSTLDGLMMDIRQASSS